MSFGNTAIDVWIWETCWQTHAINEWQSTAAADSAAKCDCDKFQTFAALVLLTLVDGSSECVLKIAHPLQW